jgi:hypothetical protein
VDFFVLLAQIGIVAVILLFGVHWLSRLVGYLFGKKFGDGLLHGFFYLLVTVWVIWSLGYASGIF